MLLIYWLVRMLINWLVKMLINGLVKILFFTQKKISIELTMYSTIQFVLIMELKLKPEPGQSDDFSTS